MAEAMHISPAESHHINISGRTAMQHIANQGPKSKMYVPYSIRCTFFGVEHSPLYCKSMMMVDIEYICR